MLYIYIYDTPHQCGDTPTSLGEPGSSRRKEQEQGCAYHILGVASISPTYIKHAYIYIYTYFICVLHLEHHLRY
jgi:hypothetical protein